MRIDDLPGELIMWVLIVSELLVFGAGISAMAVMRLFDPEGFAAAQAHLASGLAAFNTLALVTSGLCAALAQRAARAGNGASARRWLLFACLGGAVFLAVKLAEYAAHHRAGIGIDSGDFFVFYYLLTGFHAAHVVAGIVLLLAVAWHARPQPVEAGVAFWHMVDLVWVLILPPLYLIG